MNLKHRPWRLKTSCPKLLELRKIIRAVKILSKSLNGRLRIRKSKLRSVMDGSEAVTPRSRGSRRLFKELQTRSQPLKRRWRISRSS